MLKRGQAYGSSAQATSLRDMILKLALIGTEAETKADQEASSK